MERLKVNITSVRGSIFSIQILSLFLIMVSFNLFVSCHPVSDKKESTVFAKPDSITAPIIVDAGQFDVQNLDMLPAPKVVMLSQQPEPVKTALRFYVTMPNFNTEQGLALSSVVSSYKDKAGNIWFGTSGNGVSMYNGKTFTNYFTSHGLIHNFISSITEDHQGNIWFGTYGGASKFDGISFENFTTEQGLIDSDVLSILEDKKGNIWLATRGGVNRYNPSHNVNGSNLFDTYEAADGLIGGSIITIMEDRNGFLWFGGAGGISRYNAVSEARGEKAFEDFSESFGLTDEIVYSIMEDEEGTIWAGTNRLVSRYTPDKADTPGNTFTHFTTEDGLADNFVLSSIEDREGNLWFGTKGGVSRYNKADESFLNFAMEQGLADNQVMSITEDNSGSLWFSTYGGGLSKYEGKSIVEYSANQGLPGKAIYAITGDKNGDLWFAPLNGGIVQYQRDKGSATNGGTFINYTTAQGFCSDTAYNSVEDQNGNLWFGTAEGLCKYDGNSFTTYTTEQGLPDDYITALSTDREGNLWIGTYDGGASKFDGTSFTNFSTEQGLVHKTVWNFLEDKNGIIWITTRGGLSRYDGTRFMNFTKDQGLPDNKLATVIQDSKGNILMGGWGGGVSIIRKKDVDQLAQRNTIRSSRNIFEHFSTADGLANDVVYQILEDRSGNIVIGSSYGLTIIKGGISREGNQIVKDSIENYNELTGYPIKDISNNFSLHEDRRGFIWAGTGDKLVRFDFSSVHKSKNPLHVFIQSIKVNNETVSWNTLDWARKDESKAQPTTYDVPPYVAGELLKFGRTLTASERDSLIDIFKNVRFESVRPFYSIPEKLILPYVQNNISFDFLGVETTKPQLVYYRYKLEGTGEKWSPVSTNTTATFGNIFEGKYTFLVKAQSPDGVWSEPISYSFRILPPWYRSWLAYIFYAIIFIAGVMFIDRVMRKLVITKERERTMQREVAQAKEIEKAFKKMETAHTKLQSAQEQLVQQEKLASLGQLTAGIAHEIKNPLNFVNNFSEVSIELIEEVREGLAELSSQQINKGHQNLEKNGTGDIENIHSILNDIENNLRIIYQHGHRADRIVKSMLQHSRNSSSGVMEPTNISTLIKEFVNLAFHGMRAGKNPINVDINLELDERVGEVSLIAEDFSRVIVNLCNNAFDAMREKEILSKQSGDKYMPSLTVRTERRTHKVRITIKDNGTGIPENIRNKIMQAFFTTKKGTAGTGLGLYITNNIVKAHGGSMEIKSEEGVSTTFTITLPAKT